MQQIAQTIKKEAKRKNIPLKVLLPLCNLNINAISDFANGQEMSIISFSRIASELDCSTDYLIGRTNNPEAHRNNNTVSVGNVSGNSGAIGVGNTVTNNVVEKTEQAAALLDVFNNLDPVKQAKLLVYADELSKT